MGGAAQEDRQGQIGGETQAMLEGLARLLDGFGISLGEEPFAFSSQASASGSTGLDSASACRARRSPCSRTAAGARLMSRFASASSTLACSASESLTGVMPASLMRSWPCLS